MTLTSILRTHGRLLGFGFFMCLCSNFGQTFFISLFGGVIRESFNLTHGGFGSIYSMATLTSAALLLWAGRFVDRISLPVFSSFVLVALSGACLVMSSARSEAALLIAILFLRLFGQGLSSHTAITTMGRYFDSFRGRAVSIASLGHPVGESLFPIVAVAALAIYGWREIWVACAIILVLCLPVMLAFLKGQKQRHAQHMAKRLKTRAVENDATLGQALRGSQMWLMLPALMAPSFISTGLVFHQVYIAGIKGWTMTLVSSSFSAYAALSVLAVVITGPLVDRIGAKRLTGIFLAPLAGSALSVGFLDGSWAAPVYLGLLGFSAGITAVILGALWAELYGLSHLGAIKAFGQSAMVFSTGLAPAAMGLLIDNGGSIETISIGCTAYCFVASILAFSAGKARSVTT